MTGQRRLRPWRVGLDNVAGYARGGVREWLQQGRPIEQVQQLTVHRLAEALADDPLLLLDVREESEWEQGHAPAARHVPLGSLPDRAADLASDAIVAVTCSTGFRSSSAASILKRRGFSRVYNVIGGMTAWRAAGLPLVND